MNLKDILCDEKVYSVHLQTPLKRERIGINQLININLPRHDRKKDTFSIQNLIHCNITCTDDKPTRGTEILPELLGSGSSIATDISESSHTNSSHSSSNVPVPYNHLKSILLSMDTMRTIPESDEKGLQINQEYLKQVYLQEYTRKPKQKIQAQQNSHHAEPKYQCTICKVKNRTFEEHALHQRTHSTEAHLYHCKFEDCKRSFVSSRGLLFHYRLHVQKTKKEMNHLGTNIFKRTMNRD
ncbi:hypothetical protein BC833DRAFT_573904 [Globomyces pollinis-pini]|nr:hypothetical protein BC833DRAFT_573904 [Globomyces pollinis-pini]